MPLLHVALQEGFSNDTVEVTVNGAAIFSKSGVSTRTQIGFADSAETEVGLGTVDLLVSLPQKSLSKSIALLVSEPTYVGVSVEAHGIAFNVAMEPFGYL